MAEVYHVRPACRQTGVEALRLRSGQATSFFELQKKI